MLKKRIIPVIILRNGEVVQSVQFKHTNVIHKDPCYAVNFFSKWDADEIIILDVSRDTKHRDKFYDAVERLSENCFLPLTVGGWIEDLEEIRKLHSIGADKILINTHDELIKPAVLKHGAQCIVAGIDIRGDSAFVDRGAREICSLPDRIKQMEGAGEFFLSSIDHDGTGRGFDKRLYDIKLNVPKIIFGGASKPEHLEEGLRHSDAVAAANMFHYKESSVRKAKVEICGIAPGVHSLRMPAPLSL